MKILHINDYHDFSGAEKICNDIYQHFGGELFVLNDYLPKNIIRRYIVKFLFSLKLHKALKKILSDFKPDRVLIHNINLAPFPVLLALSGYDHITQMVHDATQAGYPSGWTVSRKTYKKPVGSTGYRRFITQEAYDKPKIQATLYYRWLKVFLKWKKRIIKQYISPSKALQTLLKNNGFTPTYQLGNQIKHDYIIDINQKENIILYVGAVDQRKGIVNVLDALFDQSYQLPGDRCAIIIGDGDSKAVLAHKYSNTNSIQFLGKLPNEAVLDYCQQSKIVIIPSIWFENYPTSALEGILSDAVVLGNDMGGIPEIAGQDNVFDVLDPASIQKKIDEVIDQYDVFFAESQKQKVKLIEGMERYYINLRKILNN